MREGHSALLFLASLRYCGHAMKFAGCASPHLTQVAATSRGRGQSRARCSSPHLTQPRRRWHQWLECLNAGSDGTAPGPFYFSTFSPFSSSEPGVKRTLWPNGHAFGAWLSRGASLPRAAETAASRGEGRRQPQWRPVKVSWSWAAWKQVQWCSIQEPEASSKVVSRWLLGPG